MTTTKAKKVAKPKPKPMTMAQAKAECASLGLQVAAEHDKRFKNTWLYTLNPNSGVEPVLRTQIVHKPKKKKKVLSWSEMQAVANGA